MAIIFALGGIFAFTDGEFIYTKGAQEAKIGPLELSVNKIQKINVSVWAGMASIRVGGELLFFDKKLVS